MTGKPDKEGKHWLYLNVLPHEIERGLSADLHYALYGFKEGKVLNLKNPLDKKERAKIVEQAEKIISFIDTVGHEPWVRTTIRGIVGQSIDYGLLVVAADDGVTHITKEHLGLLLAMNLPERKKLSEKPFLMFVDRVYNVPGAGTVVSGTIKQGKLKAGSELLIGPDKKGNFKKVKAKSIEMHYCRLEEANAGLIVGIAIRGIKNEEIERGMILCDEAIEPKAVKSFEAEIFVLHHPTRIASGYEPVLHCNTIAESAKFKLLDKDYLKSGESGKVEMRFKYKPQFVQVDDKFVFREGKTKGIGTITKILEYAS
jgi:elongation factor 1-alpha